MDEKIMDRRILKLAEFMHDEYEHIAEQQGWNTQDKCKVSFDELPEKNRKTMLYVAKAVDDRLRKENVEWLMELAEQEDSGHYYDICECRVRDGFP